MAYNAISPSDINADSPLTDTLFSHMRDNWIAIKDGESGATRMATAAIQPPTPGSFWAWVANVTGSSTTWTAFGGVGAGIGPEYYRWQAWRSGSFRFWFTMSRTTTTATANMRVYRNGAAYSQVYTCPVGQASSSHVFDLNLNVGDTIQIYRQNQHSCTSSVFAGMTAYPFSYIG